MGKDENVFTSTLNQFQEYQNDYKDKIKMKKRPTTYLTSFWNLLAYFAIVPYKLELDSIKSTYILTSNAVRKALSGFLYFSSLLSALSWLALRLNTLFQNSSSPLSVASNNVMKIFQLTVSLSSVFKMLCFCDIVWGRQKIFVKFVNQLSFFNLVEIPISKLLMFYAYLFINCYFSSFISLGVTNQKVEYLSFVFHTELITVPAIIIDSLSVLLLCGANFVFTSFVLTLSSVADKYEMECSLNVPSRKVQMVKGFQLYSNLRKMTKSANALMNGFVYTMYLESLIFFVDCLGALSKWEIELGSISKFVVAAISSSFSWILACEFHRKCSNVTSEWVSDCYEEEDGTLSLQDHARISNLINDMSISSIALECRFFTITYGFIGSMFGLIVTYGLIIFQMQVPSPSASS